MFARLTFFIRSAKTDKCLLILSFYFQVKLNSKIDSFSFESGLNLVIGSIRKSYRFKSLSLLQLCADSLKKLSLYINL